MKPQKRLLSLAAISSSVFLLAACEPGTEQTGETGDTGAPTFGDPARDDATGAPEIERDTEQGQQQSADPMTEPGGANQPPN